MHQSIYDYYRSFIVIKRKRHILKRIVTVLACMVIFCTTYALILPAITMEKETFCAVEEHIHSEECYARNNRSVLICTAEKLSVHTHTDSCHGSDGVLVCGLADYIIHSHDDSCYDANKNLVCELPQRSAHVHNESCYESMSPQTPVYHIHDESCNSLQQGELICMETVREGHSHNDKCYTVGTELLCTTTEKHLHTDKCYTHPLICNLSTDPHIHDDSCRSRGDLACSSEEGHSHTDDCYVILFTCGKYEGEVHSHDVSCYSAEEKLICEIPENHIHTVACCKSDLNCEIPEDPGHAHNDDCYEWITVLGCGLEEGEEEPTEPAEPVLICREPVAQAHIHGDECFETTGSEAVPICGNQDNEHKHSAECYELACGLEAHTHSLICYSNPEADIESRETWESTFAHIELTGNWNEDVVAIAETQLGYAESTRNYAVWEDNTTHGYTRYGAWYGVPYGDWCGMFASFCLNYAGVEGMPMNYGVRPWIEDLSKPELDLYKLAEDYTPIPGDLVFFDWEDDGLSDHVGIVYEVIPATENKVAMLKTIEGNSSNRVQVVTYDLNDPVLLGYSKLPEKTEESDTVYYCGMEEHLHEEGCFAEDGSVICLLTEHAHTEECTQEMSLCTCGLVEHIHDESCYDENGVLICGITEHTCVALFTMTARNNAQQNADQLNVQLVINMIDALPDTPSPNNIQKEKEQIAKAFVYYNALGNELKASVTNSQKLLDKKSLLGTDSQYSNAIQTATSKVNCYVHFDGTNGGLSSLSRAGTISKTYLVNWNIVLPETINRPLRHNYILRGWYWINGCNYEGSNTGLTPEQCYYNPGSIFTVTDHAVFYADWKAANYNFGQPNEHVVNTVSTKDFITTHLFDYSSIFNMYSSQFAFSKIDATSHDETWTALDDGQYLPGGTTEATGMILRNWDSKGNTVLSYPTNSHTAGYEHFTYQKGIIQELMNYTPSPRELFFNTNNNTNPLGVTYIGTADHLFQYNEENGYYYYNSADNAASYNRDDERFYVYNYLERTTNTDHGQGEYDFLPFNSPYVSSDIADQLKVYYNASENIYYYDHLDTMHDSKYNESIDGDRRKYTATNFWFGMSNEIQFYLPNASGSSTSNLSTHGQQMIFEFSGDDDVWVYVDNTLVLDIGGIHKARKGTINFSTGVVTLEKHEEWESNKTKPEYYEKREINFSAGEHTLTMYYMERGSSLSNCSIKFNISPKFELSLEKKDELSNTTLDGTEFHVYTDVECNNSASLWPSYESYLQDSNNTTNKLTVSSDGTAKIWGFTHGNTYYIKETSAPNQPGYFLPNGLIKLELDIHGIPRYSAVVVAGPQNNSGANPTPGYVVSKFEVNEMTHTISMTVNNSYPATDISVEKKWADGTTNPVPVTVNLLKCEIDAHSHETGCYNDKELICGSTVHKHTSAPSCYNASGDLTCLLTEHTHTAEQKCYDTDNTLICKHTEHMHINVPCIKVSSVVLNAENGWKHTWEYLPKKTLDKNNNVVDIKYYLEEVAITGFNSSINQTQKDNNKQKEIWGTAESFQDGAVYLLKTPNGLLAAGNNGLFWDTTQTAASRWTAEVTHQGLSLKNENEIFLSTDGQLFVSSYQAKNLTFSNQQFCMTQGNQTRYMTGSINNDGKAETSTQSDFTFQIIEKTIINVGLDEFEVTNTPVPEVEVDVIKKWLDREGNVLEDDSLYEDLSVTIKLLANGAETDKSVVLNAENQWAHTFMKLPENDKDGKTIKYSVKEDLTNCDWAQGDWTSSPAEYDAENNIWVVKNQYSKMLTIPVEKSWVTLTTLPKSIIVQLYAIPNHGQNQIAVPMGNPITLTAETDWKGEFVVLPPEEVVPPNETEAGVTYYIHEPTYSFAAVYNPEATIFIKEEGQDGTKSIKAGKVTYHEETGAPNTMSIVNYAMEKLPNTGGSGTTSYTAVGLLMTAAALFLMYIRKKKPEGKGAQSS